MEQEKGANCITSCTIICIYHYRIIKANNLRRVNWTGHSDTGHSNTGHSDTGHSNTGHSNTGHSNTHDRGSQLYKISVPET